MLMSWLLHGYERVFVCVTGWWPSEPLTQIEGYLFYVVGGTWGLDRIKKHLYEGQTKTGTSLDPRFTIVCACFL